MRNFSRNFKLPVFLKSTKTDSFAVWFVVTGNATPDGIHSLENLPVLGHFT